MKKVNKKIKDKTRFLSINLLIFLSKILKFKKKQSTKNIIKMKMFNKICVFFVFVIKYTCEICSEIRDISNKILFLEDAPGVNGGNGFLIAYSNTTLAVMNSNFNLLFDLTMPANI